MTGQNRRKGMRALTLWLTKAEILSMKESLKAPEYYGSNIIELIEEANLRGDFNL